MYYGTVFFSSVASSSSPAPSSFSLKKAYRFCGISEIADRLHCRGLGGEASVCTIVIPL